jgi:hypothetical protein
LPTAAFPHVTVDQNPDVANGGGVDLVNTAQGFLGRDLVSALDPDGSVVWYYYDPTNAGASIFPIRPLQNGDFLMNFGSIREVDLTGKKIREITLSQLRAAIAATGSTLNPTQVHHDLIETPNGHWILLVQERRLFTGLPGFPGTINVLGDALVDVDQNGVVGWIWRAFDHLDVKRHPYQFPDWTHANAVVYTQDGNLLVSLRHQHWILKISYADGSGDGSTLWTLGVGGDFTLSEDSVAQWFYGQHFPVILSTDGPRQRLAIFDNGTGRPNPDGTLCDITKTCYTRALVLNVDEAARTASLAWQYRPGWWAAWGGSIVQLANGNVEFDSSTVDGGPSRIVEVTSDPAPTVVWTLKADQNFYRAFRLPSLYPGVQW